MGVDACMMVRTKSPVDERQVLRWSYELGEAFSPGDFFIRDEDNGFGKARHCLTIEPVYYQYGESIEPEAGETLIEVHLSGRFYGPGYERGDLPLYLAISQWLQDKIPLSEVWYGGDSSGICAEPLTDHYRRDLWQHFLQYGHRPYHEGFETISSDNIQTPECPLCKEPMTRHGWGPNYASFSCHGCGRQRTTRDGGQTYEQGDAI